MEDGTSSHWDGRVYRTTRKNRRKIDPITALCERRLQSVGKPSPRPSTGALAAGCPARRKGAARARRSSPKNGAPHRAGAARRPQREEGRPGLGRDGRRVDAAVRAKVRRRRRVRPMGRRRRGDGQRVGAGADRVVPEAEQKSYLLRTSSGRHQQSDAAKISENGPRSHRRPQVLPRRRPRRKLERLRVPRRVRGHVRVRRLLHGHDLQLVPAAARTRRVSRSRERRSPRRGAGSSPRPRAGRGCRRGPA